MKNARLALLILATTLSHATAALAQTETTDAGKSEYDSHCSICHGDAKGNGVFGDSLKAVPPDLTLLARNNRGVFPADHVSRVIDGRVEIASHGPRDMPIWAGDTRPKPRNTLSISHMPRRPTYAPACSAWSNISTAFSKNRCAGRFAFPRSTSAAPRRQRSARHYPTRLPLRLPGPCAGFHLFTSEDRLTAIAQRRILSLHAGRNPFDVGNVRAAQPHGVVGAKSPLVLGIGMHQRRYRRGND